MKRGEKTITEPKREVPVIDEVEVAVIGGGPAGLGAALAAARNGVQVALIERYGYVGGMATGGLVICLAYMSDDRGLQVIRGIAQEIIEKLDKMNAVVYPPQSAWGSEDPKLVKQWTKWAGAVLGERISYSSTIHPEYLKILGNRLLDEANVKTLFHAWVCSTIVHDETIRGVVLESKSGRLAVLAKIIIDCTGDGDVFSFAGADFEQRDLPMGLVFRVGGVDTGKAEEFIHKKKLEELKNLTRELIRKGGTKGAVWGEDVGLAGQWDKTTADSIVWFNNSFSGVDSLDIEDLTRVEKEIRKQVIVTLEFFRENVPGFEHSFLVDTAPQVGTRASRRLKGEHILIKEEVLGGKDFDDVIATCTAGLPNKPIINIPFGCLLPKNVENLLVAGRCISTDFMTQTSIRLIPSSITTGQAAGTAAALAIKEGVPPRDINRSNLQSVLVKDGVYLAPKRSKK